MSKAIHYKDSIFENTVSIFRKCGVTICERLLSAPGKQFLEHVSVGINVVQLDDSRNLVAGILARSSTMEQLFTFGPKVDKNIAVVEFVYFEPSALQFGRFPQFRAIVDSLRLYSPSSA